MNFELKVYTTRNGKHPFDEWARKLDNPTLAKVRARLRRFEKGNPGDFAVVGAGVYELRIHHGSGFRLYFGRQGTRIIILLLGGDKGSQRKDIAKSRDYWRAYLQRGDENDLSFY